MFVCLGKDYINASLINGYANKCSYIATTSPFNEECTIQFWQMIYEQKVSQIVMVMLLHNFNITYVIIMIATIVI